MLVWRCQAPIYQQTAIRAPQVLDAPQMVTLGLSGASPVLRSLTLRQQQRKLLSLPRRAVHQHGEYRKLLVLLLRYETRQQQPQLPPLQLQKQNWSRPQQQIQPPPRERRQHQQQWHRWLELRQI